MPDDATAEASEPRKDGVEKTGSTRRWVLLGILVALAVQVVVPLSYYAREDPYDERFAWRMFSGIRLQRCQTRAFDERDGAVTELQLYGLIHEAWIGHFRRNRRRVIGAFLEQRCDQEGVTRARLENRCRSATGETAFAVQRYELACATGEMQWPEPMRSPSAESTTSSASTPSPEPERAR